MYRAVKKTLYFPFRLYRRWFGTRREYRITLEGIIFVLITFFIGFAAINTNTNLLYLIMSMMLSFFIISGILSTTTLKKIEVKRLAVRHVSALEEASVQIEVKNNKKRFSSYSLRILDYIENEDVAGVSYLFHIKPLSRESASYKIKFPHRGVYTLSGIRVLTRFPFGFFERSFFTSQEQEILVYPQTVNVRPVLEGAQVNLGEYDTGKKGQGQSLYGLREYNPTDSARFIHWKVSARTSKIMIREFEKEEKKRVTLFLDNYAASPLRPETMEAFEKAVIFAASVARFLIELEFQVQLVTSSGHIPFGTGLSHLYRIMRALAMIQVKEEKEEGATPFSEEADSMNLYIKYDNRKAAFPPGYAAVIDVRKQKIPIHPTEESDYKSNAC